MSARKPRPKPRAMSLEMAIEQERLEIMEMLEAENPNQDHGHGHGNGNGHPSPQHSKKRDSMSSTGSGSPVRRSVLDPNVPIRPRRASFSRTAPYPPPKPPSASHNDLDPLEGAWTDNEAINEVLSGDEIGESRRRAGSGAQTSPTKHRKKSEGSRMEGNYRIDMHSSRGPSSGGKRFSQGGTRSASIPNSMASVVNSTDLGGSMGGPPPVKVPKGILKQPSSPLGRSHNKYTSPRSSGDLVILSGQNKDGSLVSPPISPGENQRIEEDPDNEDDAIESSDEGSGADSSGDEDDTELRRGRRRRRSKGATEAEAFQKTGLPTSAVGGENGDDDDDKAASVPDRSLIEPEVNVIGPGGERLSGKRPGVHPTTSFDNAASNQSTPMPSDEEADITDIRRAQRLSVHMSPIQSTPESHRTIRTIVRGEFAKLQDESARGLRRQRTYLVCSDLSDEAAHALEWTIGTVLRDGDTLLALYAVDEETGTGRPGAADAGSGGIAIGDAALAVKDQAAVIGSQTAKAEAASSARSPSVGRRSPSMTRSSSMRRSLSAIPSPLTAQPINSLAPITNALSAGSRASSRDPVGHSRAERERLRATEDLTNLCIKLLRKTRLQVRVVIEVIHCKSPKHLITEVIDFIEPTLVVLGSRGRSALKGVLLGSFSNYLVTKSSVPVMVARKKLKKHWRYRPNVRLSNNLMKPGFSLLQAAKID